MTANEMEIVAGVAVGLLAAIFMVLGRHQREAQEMTKEERLMAVADDIKPLVAAFIAESLTDEDIVGQSVDFKAGYEKGLKEGLAGSLSFIAKRFLDQG